MTDEGNCLKLGDFGSAVKIKAHTTMPGELQGFVGTQGKKSYFISNLFFIIIYLISFFFLFSLYGSRSIYEE